MVPKPLIAAVGWSTKADAIRAGKEAAESAVACLSSQHARLAIVFGSSWLDQSLLMQGMQSVLGDLPLMGGSTAGEITPEGPTTHSCVVLLLASEALICSVGSGEAADRNPREAGQQAAYTAAQGFRGSPRTGFLMFGDGLVSGYVDVIRGMQEVLGTSALVVGAMSGDDLRFTQTYQYANRQVMSRGVVGALLGGSLAIGVGIEHGFAPISRPWHITRAHGNIVYELNNHPAALVYEEYFGAEHIQRMRQERFTRPAIAYPLGIQQERTQQWILRNVTSFHEDGSLACNGEVTEGAWLQLMIGSRELALEAAYKAAQQAIRPLSRVACVLMFDSVARRILLGPQHAVLEIDRIRKAIGPSTVLAGCYTYGEQASFGLATGTERTLVQTGSVLVVALGI